MKIIKILFFFLSIFFITGINSTTLLADKLNASAFDFNKVSHKSKNKNDLQRDIELDKNWRPINTNYVDSKSGKFRIHYNISGKNAVSVQDENNNNIPDYVDSVLFYSEYVYDFYVNKLAYKEFALDTGGGGSKAYDIYIWDLGNYDSVDKGGVYGFNVNSDGEVLPHREFNRYYSYSVIDNDFSAKDTMKTSSGKYRPAFFTTGINALKITLAHELHHAVQNIYGLYPQNETTFMEMTSTFYEYRLFPEINDYLQYANLLFHNPEAITLGKTSSYNGYCFTLLFQCLYKKYGDESIKKIWELAYDGIPYFYGLDSVLREKGSNTADFWKEFLNWMYFTGSRAIDGKYFDQAKKMDTIKFFKNLNFVAPEKGEKYLLKPFEIRAYHFNINKSVGQTNDSLDVIMTNCDYPAASLDVEYSKEYSISLSDFSKENSIKLDKLELFFNFTSEENYIVNNFYEKPGVHTLKIEYAFPNPMNFNLYNSLYFPAIVKSNIGEELFLTIYSQDMTAIENIILPVTVLDQKLVLEYTNKKLSSGVYFYSIENQNQSEKSLGKFTVINK